MKRLIRMLICVITAFSFIIPSAAVESQDKFTDPPEIISLAECADGYNVSFSHTLEYAEEMRELIYSMALKQHKTEEALLNSNEKYLTYKTRLYLEMSKDSYTWHTARELPSQDFILTRDEIFAFMGEEICPRIFLRICLASENYREENIQLVYLYAPSESIIIYVDESKNLIPTQTKLIFSEPLKEKPVLFIPEVKGYIFDGWSGEDDVRIGAVPENTSEITLKAHFIPRTYEINYVLTTVAGVSYPFGAADITKHPTKYEVGTPAKIGSVNSPVDGYTFGGWYTASDFSGEATDEITPGTTGDITLYAKWISDEETEHKKYLERQQYIKDKKFGDPDDDGKITSADARYVLRAAVGLDAADYEMLKRVDYYNSGKISSDNARTTLRISVGLDDLYDILLENGLLP